MAAAESTQVLLERARDALRTTFGYDSFRDGQERAIAAVLAGRDVLVVMPTGSGKSVCYQVPALVLPGVTVVVSPLIALMKDQVDALALRGVPVTFVNSSIGIDEQWERLAALEAGAFKLVYVAPERFRSRAFRGALANVRVSLLAVDEAHCISQWGHDFRPDYRRLKEVRALLPDVPTIALTATATPDVRDDIVTELAMQDPGRIVTGFDRPNLVLEVRKVRGKGEKEEALIDLVRSAAAKADDAGLPAGLVYAGTRKRAEEIAAALNRAFPPSGEAAGDADGAGAAGPCRPYHAGLDPVERRKAQEDFMEGRVPWVSATNAFGMGVDKSDIRFVVHAELPGSVEAYYQEAGRGGRDGLPCTCVLLFADGDRRLQEFFIEGSNPSRETIEAVHRFLFSVGENPIFRALVELEGRFRATSHGSSANPLAFGSSVSILERAGALERLDHYENLAELTPLASPWPPNPYPDRATVKHALHDALGRVFERTGGEAVGISLERWARELSLAEESIRRGLASLEEDGAVRYVPPFRGRAIRLPAEPVRLPDVVDFRALAERRKRDEERLADVIAFARAPGCRRDAILAYFGEPAPEGGCGRCDRCRQQSGGAGARVRELEEGELTLVRKVLSGVARAKGRCGRGRIIGMLRGSKAQEVADIGFSRLSTYGLLRAHGREEIQRLLDLLEDDGCIRSAGDKYPTVHLTERGVRVLKGEVRPALALPSRKPRAPAAPAPSQQAEDPSDHDEGLFQRLRHLRREIADELGVPAYRVFNDRTLKAMARVVPRTREELIRVPGVGAVTLERFGERFLELLRGTS